MLIEISKCTGIHNLTGVIMIIRRQHRKLKNTVFIYLYGEKYKALSSV